MIPIERQQYTLILPPISANNANFSGNTYVDTAGWAHARFLLITGALAAGVGSTAHTTAPLVEECDTTGGTYVAVTNAALADAISDSEDNSLFAIDVDLTGSHRRYMRIQAPDAGAGACILGIVAILSKKESGPPHNGLAADAGLTELISA
jgi:hypothetical protein